MNGYGEIYRFEFDGTCNPFGTLLTTKGKVSILKKDYVGDVTIIPYGQATPITIDYPTTDDDVFYPIKGSMVSFKVLGGVIGIDSISSEREKEYLLEYYRDGNLFWRGFVSPEMCEEDIFLRYPAIDFKTIDGLGSLEGSKLNYGIETGTGVDRSVSIPPKGDKAISHVINVILDNIGLQLPYNLLVNLRGAEIPYLLTDKSLDYLRIIINSLYNSNGTRLNPLEIMKSFGHLFNAVVFQDKGEWWFLKLKDIAYGYRNTYKVDVYNETTGSNTIPILEHGTDFLIVAEPKRKLKRLYKSIELEYEQLYQGGNFDTNFSMINAPAGQHPNLYKPTYTSYTETTTVGGVTTTTTYYDKLEFIKIYNQTNPSYQLPDYDYFQNNGNAKGYMIYNSDTDDYGMVVKDGTTNSDYVSFNFLVLSHPDNEYKYDFGVSSITKNIKIAIELNGKYYDAVNEEWVTSELINTFDDVETINITNLVMPESNTLQIRFYANTLTTNVDFDGTTYTSLSEYHTFNLSSNIPVRKRQLITATNIKDATIVPDKIKVYSGMTVPHPFDATTYPVYDPWYYPSFVYGQTAVSGYVLETPSDINFETPAPDRTLEVAERDEQFYYSLQELAARNILNQYSDNTNIFSGTIIGKNLRFGAIYKFPNQGALADKLFFPLSMQLNERDCTADVIFMELSTNEIDPSIVSTIYDAEDNIRYQQVTSSKKKIVTG